MLRSFGLVTLYCLSPLFVVAAEVSDPKPVRPNILWITSEDNGPDLGCYGDTYADTPHLDALAAKSLRYRTAWSNAPVCAPARTTLVSGMYATSLGGHHMRSGVKLPDDLTLYPKAFRDAGYFCTNRSKTDYNFADGDKLAGWHENGRKAHFRDRPSADVPFFSVFNYTISHESQIRNKPHTLVHDPAKAPVPAYHPDVPEVRRDWAQYYDRLTQMDDLVGQVLSDLEEDGLTDSTIVFYYGDHGSGMPRSKRWPFNSGLHVPLIVHVPSQFKDVAPADYMPGGLSDRLVSFVDFAPTALSMAGIKPPSTMQGVPFAGAHTGPAKDFIFGFRGRMDERLDRVRSCTDGRFVYLRHFYPDRPYLKYISYMFQTPTTRIWKEMFDAGKLNEIQAKVWQPKPLEELFDLQSDPDEVHNLVNDPAMQQQLETMRSAVKQWMIDIRDLGVLPEGQMHDLAEDQAPRTMALSTEYPITELIDAAWASTASWQSVDAEVLADNTALTQNDHPGLRYWGARGLTLSLMSHGSVLDADLVSQACETLTALLDDPSGNVVVAAAEGLLVAGDATQREAAAMRLVQQADVTQSSHPIAIAALNVIDAQRDKMGTQLDRINQDFPRKHKAPPRMGKYVGNLLERIQSQSVN